MMLFAGRVVEVSKKSNVKKLNRNGSVELNWIFVLCIPFCNWVFYHCTRTDVLSALNNTWYTRILLHKRFLLFLSRNTLNIFEWWWWWRSISLASCIRWIWPLKRTKNEKNKKSNATNDETRTKLYSKSSEVKTKNGYLLSAFEKIMYEYGNTAIDATIRSADQTNEQTNCFVRRWDLVYECRV